VLRPRGRRTGTTVSPNSPVTPTRLPMLSVTPLPHDSGQAKDSSGRLPVGSSYGQPQRGDHALKSGRSGCGSETCYLDVMSPGGKPLLEFIADGLNLSSSIRYSIEQTKRLCLVPIVPLQWLLSWLPQLATLNKQWNKRKRAYWPLWARSNERNCRKPSPKIKSTRSPRNKSTQRAGLTLLAH
jgi:hypothetical protein